MRFRYLLGRYGLVLLGCLTSLMLSALFCFNSCDLTKCTEYCSEQRRSNHGLPNVAQMGPSIPENSSKTKTFLLILILSAPINMEQRDSIRQTWLKDVGDDVLHYFVLGSGRLDEDEQRTLASENSRFRDILLLTNVNDSYDKLTSKLLAVLVHVYHNVDFRFLLKVDDDSFVQVNMMLKELLSVRNKKRLYWGYFNGRAHVQKTGMWQETDWMLCDYYLPYALGGGYVISSDLVAFIASNSDYLKLYKSEDVSLGTWLAPVDVHRIHDLRFDTAAKSRGCSNSYIVTHKQSVYEMRQKYWLLQEEGTICRHESKDTASYVYNWKVPPSQCCKRNESLHL